jgi:hypothetical protein
MKSIASILSLIFFLYGCDSTLKVTSNDETTIEITTDEYLDIIVEAYLYGYPLLIMDFTKKVTTNTVTPHPTLPRAPINQLGHFRTFPDQNMKTVVKPNVDTYYSSAWMDLSQDVLLFHMPATERYYLLPFYDAYSNVYASPGTRTTGTEALNLMIVGPKWKGEVLDGYTLIQSPTESSWLLGRIQVNDPKDGSTVVKNIQDQMSLIPLSALNDSLYIKPNGSFNEEFSGLIPVKAMEEMEIEEYLNRLTDIMSRQSPLTQDQAILAKMKKIGLEPGQAFELTKDNLILTQKLKAIPKVVHKRFRDTKSNPAPENMVNNWSVAFEGIGTYQSDYTRRAYIAFAALGANLPEDAIYPIASSDINGEELNARYKYLIHMEQEDLPPVNAFWSLTAYTEDDFLVENELNRFALGDRDSLTYNSDGSLDLYIQSEAPENKHINNWLPIPQDGPFSLAMRLYWPEDRVLSKQWSPPGIVPIDN